MERWLILVLGWAPPPSPWTKLRLFAHRQIVLLFHFHIHYYNWGKWLEGGTNFISFTVNFANEKFGVIFNPQPPPPIHT